MFEPLNNLLKKSAKENRFIKQVTAYEILTFFSKTVEKVCGIDVKNNVKPKYIKNNIITVLCTNSVYAQEIALYKKTIITQINSHFQKQIKNFLIQDIKFIS